jgi:hypothetical protein
VSPLMYKLQLSAALITCSCMLAACNTSGAVSGPPAVSLSTTNDAASIQRGRSAYETFFASGLRYHFSGRLSDLNVSSAGGRTSVIAHAVPGDYLDVRLEQIPNNLFSFGTSRARSSFPAQRGTTK